MTSSGRRRSHCMGHHQNGQNGQNGQKGQTEATAAGAEGCESNHFVVENSSNAGTVSTMSSEPFSEHYNTRL